MSVSRLNYKVEITPHRSVFTFDNAEIGLFSGKLVWVTNYDSTYTSANSKAGILAENWVSSISKSVQASRKGNTASIGGGTINVEGSSNLFNLLDAQNISIYNSVLTIAESRDGGAYQVIKTGLITQSQNDLTVNAIPFQDISKGDVTTLTQEINDSGKFYPVNFGLNPLAKTVTVKDSFDIPLLDERTPVFEVTDVSFDIIKCIIPYSDSPTIPQVTEWAIAINSLIDSGRNIAIRQGDKLRVLKEAVSYDPIGVWFYLQYGDNANEPFVIDGGVGVEDYVLVEPIGTTGYSDFFDGSFNSTGIETYEDDQYIVIPQFIDQTRFENNAVQLVDVDGKGWADTTGNFEPVGTVSTTNGTVVSITGDWSNVVDDDIDTSLVVRMTTGAGNIYNVTVKNESIGIETFDQVPQKLVLCGYIQRFTNNPSQEILTNIKITVTLKDVFGNSVVTSWDYDSPATAETQRLLDSAVPTAYGEALTINDRERFQYEVDNTVVAIPFAGVEMSLDLAGFESEIQWTTGVVYDVQVEVVGSYGAVATDDIAISDLRVHDDRTFSSKDIYCDWQGRQNYADTEYIRTLPEAYEHTIQLQNYENRGETVPAMGWGLEYPVVSDWTQYYDTSNNYGGVANVRLNSSSSYWQILTASQARSDLIKQKLCRLLWGIGSGGRDGIERIFPMVEGLWQEDSTGVQITYKDLVKGSKPSFKDRKFEDIFAAVNVGYSFDAGANANSKSINVSNVDQENYEIGYVTGVTDPDVAADLWNYGNVLYKVYGVLNQFPTELQDCGWMQSETQVIDYIKKCYQWQGVYTDGSAFSGRQRYIASFRVPYTFGIDNGLDVGSKIQLSIPNKTWNGAVEVYHSGVITSVSDTFAVSEPFITVTAEMLGGNLAGSDVTVYVEGTDSGETITVGTDSETVIVEGA